MCSECHARLPVQAEACAECGYPVTNDGAPSGNGKGTQATLLEYKLIQLLGGCVVLAGVIAAMADSPIAATVAITIGSATYVTGLLGSWWNSGD
ncbi:MAG TPA: hypothetical protein VEC35_20775 [Noviherbaspirillum sp.]|nr:hypothetical protein [Noviherbaspirillum sp.]